MKDYAPIELNSEDQIQIGIRHWGQPTTELEIDLTFDADKNSVVEIPNRKLHFSSGDVENSVLKNLTVVGSELGYSTIQVDAIFKAKIKMWST